jgi:hypothetical protein
MIVLLATLKAKPVIDDRDVICSEARRRSPTSSR